MQAISSYHDRDLLILMAQNDHNAFEELWNRYWELAYNVAYKRLKDDEQCQDTVQDIFIDIWNRRTTLTIDNFPAYLNSAIRYKSYRLLSRKGIDDIALEPFHAIVDTAMRADGSVIEKELKNLVDSWMEALPEKRKEIFILYFKENLSTKEIAERIDVSQKTVQNQIGLLSKELRKKLLFGLMMIPGL